MKKSIQEMMQRTCGRDTGGAGTDTYIYNYGDGTDHIFDNKGERNILRFGDGIDEKNITLHLGSLMVDTGTGSGIHIEGFDRNDVFNSSSIGSFEFADGSTLTTAELLARGFDLDGTANNDTILGTNTTDRITGRAGDDLLGGGAGNDTYIFNRGDGHDTISENDATAGNIDTIRFGDCIAAGDIAFALDGRDLILDNTVTGDRITVKDYANGEAFQIERVVFADGTAWDAAYLQGRIAALLPAATAGDDVMQGWAGTNVALQGLGGNDTLLGTMGGDTYQFNRGDGQDTILDASGADVIRFGEGITESDVTFSRSGADLILHIGSTTSTGSGQAPDQLTIRNWGLGDANRIERVEFAPAVAGESGAVWDAAYLQSQAFALLPAATAGDDVIQGWAGQDVVLQGLGGNEAANDFAWGVAA